MANICKFCWKRTWNLMLQPIRQFNVLIWTCFSSLALFRLFFRKLVFYFHFPRRVFTFRILFRQHIFPFSEKWVPRPYLGNIALYEDLLVAKRWYSLTSTFFLHLEFYMDSVPILDGFWSWKHILVEILNIFRYQQSIKPISKVSH